jgi:hypothetical protein
LQPWKEYEYSRYAFQPFQTHPKLNRKQLPNVPESESESEMLDLVNRVINPKEPIGASSVITFVCLKIDQQNDCFLLPVIVLTWVVVTY